MDPGPEPLLVLITSIAARFRDEIHGVIGKNIFSLTPRSKPVRDLSNSKYSFLDDQFINPRILEDLHGWLSDTGNQVVAINISESNTSNRYFSDTTIEVKSNDHPVVTATHESGRFSYQYIGVSFNGVHLLQTWSSNGGSGTFCNVILVTISTDTALSFSDEKCNKTERLIIKSIGSIPLGDRYIGAPTYKYGILNIPVCKGMKTVRNRSSRFLIL